MYKTIRNIKPFSSIKCSKHNELLKTRYEKLIETKYFNVTKTKYLATLLKNIMCLYQISFYFPKSLFFLLQNAYKKHNFMQQEILLICIFLKKSSNLLNICILNQLAKKKQLLITFFSSFLTFHDDNHSKDSKPFHFFVI